MLEEVEKLYAARFGKGSELKYHLDPNAHLADGDLKKARDQMRTVAAPSKHHFSVFRSGVLIGLSIPALVIGTYYGQSTPIMGFE